MTFRPSRRACSALAIAAYLVVALFTFRNVLSSPSTHLGYPAVITQLSMISLDHRDQAMVIATIVRNAHLLVHQPTELFADVGQCYPMPSAHTLGEHMFGVGLLAALPYALTADPILSYNIVLVLTIWIPAITMYFLSLRFTRSPGAAFVAGLVFALVPARLVDPSHPYVHGDLWAPAVLLFLHKLFVHARWRDALGLAFFLGLEVIESLYPLISTCLVATVYGLYLLARHRENLVRALPKLAMALAAVGALTWVVLGPYLETSAAWGLLSGRQSVLLFARDFLPGSGDFFPGHVVLALIAVALLDRMRGPRLIHGEDPRLAFLGGGIVVLWSAIGHITIPLLGVAIESPFLLLRDVIPGLAAVRALSSVAIGGGIAMAFLAGYAALALSERLRPVPWMPVLGSVAIAFTVLTARFVPSVAEASFGRTFQIIPYEARPPQENIDLVRNAGRGAQIDFPLGNLPARKHRLDLALSLLLASYDPRPLGACYNSFISPVNDQVIELAEQLPSPAASEALGALGFETVLVDHKRAGQKRLAAFRETLAASPDASARLTEIGATPSLDAFRIAPRTALTSDVSVLGPTDDVEPVEALIPSATLSFEVANPTTRTFVQAKPLELSDVLVRWVNASGDLVHEEVQRTLLPIAVGPNGTLPIYLDASTPRTPGEYTVQLARADDPANPIAMLPVHLPALEEIMESSRVALHLHKAFLREALVPIGMETAYPPTDSIDLILGPGATSAAEIRGHGRIAAHWNALGPSKRAQTQIVTADVQPTGVAGRVQLRLPIPVEFGPQALLLTPIDDPWTLLAGAVVFPDVPTVRRLRAEAGQASP